MMVMMPMAMASRPIKIRLHLSAQSTNILSTSIYAIVTFFALFCHHHHHHRQSLLSAAAAAIETPNAQQEERLILFLRRINK